MAASRTACSHLPWMALPVLLLSATMAWGAPVMKVTEVRVGQQPAKSASVKIFYPNEKKSATKDLAVGDGLDPGVEIVVPANTEITLTSLNGNVIKVQPNTQFKVIGVSDKGETFNVQLGRIAVFVNKQLSFFSVSSGAVAAAAKRTRYTFEVAKNRDVMVATDEGVVEVERPDRLAINDKEYGGYKARDTVNAGDQLEWNPKATPRRYDSFEAVYAAFSQQLADARRRRDPEAEAEWQYNLANLTFDETPDEAGARKAAALFEAGLQLPISKTDPEWWVLFAEGVGDSLFEAGEFEQAERRHMQALDKLEDELDPDLESYLAGDLFVSLGHDYLKLNRLDDALEAFESALDVFDVDDDPDDEQLLEVGSIYYSLGVANHRLREWDDAEDYFEDALEIFKDLGPDFDVDPDFIKTIEQHLEDVTRRVPDVDDEDDYVGFEFDDR